MTIKMNFVLLPTGKLMFPIRPALKHSERSIHPIDSRDMLYAMVGKGSSAAGKLLKTG